MRRLLAAILLVLALSLLGCGEGEDAQPRPSGRPPPRAGTEAILHTLRAARDAVVAGEARRACGLLTPHGREMAIRLVRYFEDGTVLRRSPRSGRACRRALARELARSRRAAGNNDWTDDLRRSRFAVLGVRGSVARARLTVEEPYAPAYLLTLRKTPAGWRVDDLPMYSDLERVSEQRGARPTPRRGPPPRPPPPPPPPPPY